ncbi:hypothetical protein SAMN04487926_11630 [Paraburkholderia steynii]|uniref:Uncharacterized protein n=1 Tax=Paraburkholderia steynii TaxID=1245441 RepID=A0A7Z7BBJ2_9BURK|nr:hypothetical protein [Paraburkholderia steynii]SDI38893.1 hypothetical protein SAMN04487926_11630 [Paraburkholderia steynii]
MGKTSRATPEQEGEISVSMVKFTMRGSDASLQKGLDTIRAALAQAGFAAAVPEVKQIRSTPAKQLSGELEDGETGSFPQETNDNSDTEDAASFTHPPVKKATSPKKAPNYKIIKDLNFDDIEPALKDFVNEKNPKTDLNKYLCIAYWFKHHKGLEDLTTEHFFTAYMTHSWSLPPNAAIPIRDLRHAKRQWLVPGSTTGTSTISNAGERRVQEMSKAES